MRLAGAFIIFKKILQQLFLAKIFISFEDIRLTKWRSYNKFHFISNSYHPPFLLQNKNPVIGAKMKNIDGVVD